MKRLATLKDIKPEIEKNLRICDFLGQPIYRGDFVIYMLHTKDKSWLEIGFVEDYTPKKIRLTSGRTVFANRIVKVNVVRGTTRDLIGVYAEEDFLKEGLVDGR